MRAFALASVLAGIALGGGCDRRDDLDGSRRPPPGLESEREAYALPTDGKARAYDFLDNRLATLTYRRGFLLIDAGEPHLAVHRDGGGDWITGAAVDGERASLVNGRGAALWIPFGKTGLERGPDGDVAITLRARPAAADQLASVYLDERRLGDIRMAETGWGSYRITAPASSLRAGEGKLRLFFRDTGEIGGHVTAAAIGRIAVGPPGRDPPAGPRFDTTVETREGDRLPAIAVPDATRLSHVTWIPESAPELSLAVTGGGDPAAVVITGAGGEPETLWEGRAPGAWTPIRADLAAYGGDVARIELVASGAAAWGAPQILVDPPEPREAPASAGAMESADHVIVWVVSGLRPDRAYDPERAPAMAAFSEGALRAPVARSPSPQPGRGHAAMWRGDARHGGGGPSLAERFQQAGFSTAAFAGRGALSAEDGFARGTDVLSATRGFSPAEELWERAREVLESRQGGHAFVYVATGEPDLPYAPSDASAEASWREAPVELGRGLEPLAEAVRLGHRSLSARERRYVEALYDAAVRDADRAFSAMLADLEALGVADRTAVILVADYGQAMFGRERFGNRPSLHEEMVRVPLAARIPGAPAREVGEAEIVDVYATALSAAGISASPGVASRDLAAGEALHLPRPQRLHIPGRARGLAIGRYKLIVDAHGEHELYDLVRDPRELDDLSGAAPIAERYLRGVFGLTESHGDAWDRNRWGEVNNAEPALAADVGA